MRGSSGSILIRVAPTSATRSAGAVLLLHQGLVALRLLAQVVVVDALGHALVQARRDGGEVLRGGEEALLEAGLVILRPLVQRLGLEVLRLGVGDEKGCAVEVVGLLPGCQGYWRVDGVFLLQRKAKE